MIYYICQGPLVRSVYGTQWWLPQSGGLFYNYIPAPALAIITGALATSLPRSGLTEGVSPMVFLGARCAHTTLLNSSLPADHIYLAVLLRFPVAGGMDYSPSGMSLQIPDPFPPHCSQAALVLISTWEFLGTTWLATLLLSHTGVYVIRFCKLPVYFSFFFFKYFSCLSP